MSLLPVVAASVDPGTAPYWEAAAQGRLVVPFCPSCDEAFWYPRGFCPRCHAVDLAWREVSAGRVYSFTVVRRAFGRWADVTPYLVAYVTLDGGPTLLSHVVGCEPDQMRVDLPVEPWFDRGDPGPDGSVPVALRFRPLPAALDG